MKAQWEAMGKSSQDLRKKAQQLGNQLVVAIMRGESSSLFPSLLSSGSGAAAKGRSSVLPPPALLETRSQSLRAQVPPVTTLWRAVPPLGEASASAIWRIRPPQRDQQPATIGGWPFASTSQSLALCFSVGALIESGTLASRRRPESGPR